MQAAASAVGLAFFTCVSQAAHAGIVSFTSKPDFEAALDSGAYTEPQMFNTYPNYAGSGFSYTASATSGRFSVSGDLSTDQIQGNPGSIVFNFGSGINAFGGYFYDTNADTSISSLPLTFDLNNGAFVTTSSRPSASPRGRCGLRLEPAPSSSPGGWPLRFLSLLRGRDWRRLPAPLRSHQYLSAASTL